MIIRRLRFIAAAGLMNLSAVMFAWAAEAPAVANPPSPRFDIREFKVEGNSLLTEALVAETVKPHAGLSRDFGDVQRALEALQAVYQKKGYSAVQVVLPEQELEAGVVRLRVIEQKIASVTVEGNEFYENDNVMRTLPTITEGAMPNMREVRSSLKVANENPSKQTAVLFRNNDAEDSVVDVTVKVIDEKPWKAFLTLDNTGSRETLHGRIGFGFQHYNVFGKDHRVTVQYITNNHFPQNYFNPEHRVNIFGGAYTIPLYERGDSVDFIAGYSNVDSGQIAQGAISVTGKGLVLGVHYNHNLAKIDNYDHKVIAGFDFRSYRNDVLNNGAATALTPHVTATPWSVTYEGQWQREQRMLSFSVGASVNLLQDWLASHGDDEIYNGSPYLAEENFKKLNFSVDYLQPFAKTWQLHAALSGQWTNDHLIPGEQFRVGGMDSVRGWHESVISGDEGFRGSVEFISPDFGNKISENVGLRGLIFLDKGYVDNNKGEDGTPKNAGSQKNIASIGIGLRYNYKRDVVARLDLARVVHGDLTDDNPFGSREAGDNFGHVSLGWIW